MDRDVAKLQAIARDLSELGLELTNRSTPPDVATCNLVGQAFVAMAEAVDDISAALERGALTAQERPKAG